MPGRNIPLVNDQIYHIVNRGINAQPVFFHSNDYERAIEIMAYYQNLQISNRFSFFKRLNREERDRIISSFKKEKDVYVEIISYCFMPNHIHILLRQMREDGISNFMSKFANSYTRYVNTKNKRFGPLFQGKFKAVRIETDEQLLHVMRYIHLNPYTSYLVKNISSLENYRYSSYNEYMVLDKGIGICKKDIIMSHFKDIKSYRKFILDQAEYQRKLAIIKHLILE